MGKDWAELWYDLPFAAFDVETTGFDEHSDKIIEVGIVHFDGGQQSERFGWLIDPQRPIPDAVVRITGIRNEDVAGKPTFADVANEVHAALSGRALVAYNFPFDRKFLSTAFAQEGLAWPDDSPTFDPLIFARQFFRTGSKRLGDVAERLGIDLTEAHRAVHDAECVGHILFAFRDRLPPRLQEIQVLQAQWEKQQRAEIAQRKGRLDDEASTTSWLASEAQAIGLGPAYIYGNEVDPLRALYMNVPDARRDDT